MKEERGMVKWAPYKSLTEQEVALRAMQRKKQKKDRPLLSNDEAMEINEVLINYHKQEVVLSYFKNGYVYEKEGIIERLDPTEGTLKIDGSVIKIKDIVSLKNKS